MYKPTIGHVLVVTLAYVFWAVRRLDKTACHRKFTGTTGALLEGLEQGRLTSLRGRVSCTKCGTILPTKCNGSH